LVGHDPAEQRLAVPSLEQPLAQSRFDAALRLHATGSWRAGQVAQFVGVFGQVEQQRVVPMDVDDYQSRSIRMVTATISRSHVSWRQRKEGSTTNRRWAQGALSSTHRRPRLRTTLPLIPWNSKTPIRRY